MITEQDGGSRDPEDNRILAAAVGGNATYLVNRNAAHFPETFRGVIAIDPAGFLQLLRDAAAQENAGDEDEASRESEASDASPE